jgi:hypothetical protein
MFKRASVHDRNKDEFINIDERLAPYGDADQGREPRERVVAGPVTRPAQHLGVEGPIAPLHLVK